MDNYFDCILEDEYADLLKEKIMLTNVIARLEESTKYNFTNLINHYRRELIRINKKIDIILDYDPKISNGQTINGTINLIS
jgi:hypothetical protein